MADNNTMLYICATPIGNLEDITLRVLRILKKVDYIAAEDTRRTKALLTHYGISKPLISYHEHNKREKGSIIIERLQNGETAALVTDAGMPCVSDPGYDIIKLCIENGIPFTVCPGASAAVTALALSGLDTERFCFEGFLPANKKERNERIKNLIDETRTIIFYEAPHRLLECLNQLKSNLGEQREAAVVRELTKIYEEAKRGNLSQLCEYYEQNQPRGEFVVIVEGRDEREIASEKRGEWQKLSIGEHMSHYLDAGMEKKDAIKAVAKDRGVPKNEVYSYYNK